MKRILPRLLPDGPWCAPLTRADPADDAIVAGMKLSASPNYSWTTTTDRGSR